MKHVKCTYREEHIYEYDNVVERNFHVKEMRALGWRVNVPSLYSLSAMMYKYSLTPKEGIDYNAQEN